MLLFHNLNILLDERCHSVYSGSADNNVERYFTLGKLGRKCGNCLKICYVNSATYEIFSLGNFLDINSVNPVPSPRNLSAMLLPMPDAAPVMSTFNCFFI